MTATKVKVASKKPIAFFDMAWGGWEFCINYKIPVSAGSSCILIIHKRGHGLTSKKL
jgi:hypothetical protein